MQKTLYLHIGAPKCGSTFVQRVMLKNRELLAENGINYPVGPSAHPGNGSEATSFDVHSLDILFDGFTSVFLSHEDLISKGGQSKKLRDVCDSLNLDVVVVCFIRPFSEFIFGDYSQHIKQYFHKYLTERAPLGGRNFEEFAVDRARVAPLDRFLDSWKSNMKPTRICVAPSSTILQTMRDLLGDLPLDTSIARAAANPSLKVADCDRICDAIRNHDIPDNEIIELIRSAQKNTTGEDAGRTPERIRWIEAMFRETNKGLLLKYGVNNFLT